MSTDSTTKATRAWCVLLWPAPQPIATYRWRWLAELHATAATIFCHWPACFYIVQSITPEASHEQL